MNKSILILLILLIGVINIKAQNDTWAVVMADATHGQAYEGDAEFPVDFIAKQKAKGQYITDATYGNGEWVITTGVTKYQGQIYTKSKDFPATWVEEKWNAGYDITKITFGNNQWLVVMSKNAGLTGESWGKRGSFEEIKEFIQAKWNDKKDIINIAFGNGEWVANLANGADYHYQTYNWGTYFPHKWVSGLYEKDYHITSMTYGEGVWVVVMSKHSTTFKEKYTCSEEFPAKWVEEQWAAGRRLKAIHYNYEHSLTESYEEFYNSGVAAANKGEHDLAIYYYTQAINIQPNSEVYNNRAWSKYLNGQCHGALSDANASIKMQGHEYNYHTRASIYMCLDRCREALSDFNATINVAEKDQGIYYNDRAEARVCLGNIDDAIADYNKAISVDPNNASKYRLAKSKIEKKVEKKKPTITWDYPHNSFVSSTESSYQIKACVHSEVAVTSMKILVNGQSFTSRGFGVEDDCTESVNQKINLKSGQNIVEIEVTTADNTTRSEKRTIEYKSHGSGNYHALLIGVQSYDDFAINDLNKPIADVEKLEQVLTSKYTFEKNDVHMLKDPTKDDIINKLIYLQERLSDKDNLLIFYSGHGMVKNEIGYWLPKDAQKSQRSKWFSNSELKDYVNSIKTKHTLVIADACFSGSIFTGGYRDVTEFACTEMEKIPSRRAMTSGANTVVPDNSIFFKYLVKKLEENNTSCLSAETLYSKVKPAVIYNSPNNHIPQFGVLPQAGDEGGNFIFRTK